MHLLLLIIVFLHNIINIINIINIMNIINIIDFYLKTALGGRGLGRHEIVRQPLDNLVEENVVQFEGLTVLMH